MQRTDEIEIRNTRNTDFDNLNPYVSSYWQQYTISLLIIEVKAR